jgi:flavin-dependent dehydrogenase
MSYDYDVIIAGGGLAGTIAAQSVSYYSKQKLSVLVIDRSKQITPGQKNISGWTCGDAVSKETVDFMTEKIKISWTEPEIEHHVKGVMAFSPDRETSIPFDGDGYMLNRQKLPEVQNQRAQKMGVNFDFEINLTGLVYDDNQVTGVQGVDNKTRGPYKKKTLQRLKERLTGVMWNLLDVISCILIKVKKTCQSLILTIVLFI